MPDRSGWKIAFVVLVALILLVSVWSLAFERIQSDREDALALQKTVNANLAQSHAASVSDTLDKLAVQLRLFATTYRMTGNPKVSQQVILAVEAERKHVSNVRIYDRTGTVIHSTTNDVGVHLGDRPYFTELRDNPNLGVHLGQPIIGRLTGQWVVPLSLRLTNPKGEFNGIVMMSLDAASFLRLYEPTVVGNNGSLALIGLDGITRIRRNGEQVSFGGDSRGSELFTHLKQSPHGIYTAVAASDGVQRMAAYQAVEGFPLVCVVATSLDDLYGRLSDSRSVYLRNALWATVIVLLAAVAMVHVIRHDARSVRLLYQSDRRFRALFEISSDWYWEMDEHHRFTHMGGEGLKAYGGVGPDEFGKCRWELPNIEPLSSDWATHIAVHEERKVFRDFEYVRTMPDGQRKYFSVSGSPVFHPDGRFKGYHGTCAEVTPRVLLHRKLTEMSDRMAFAVEGSDIGLWDWRADEGMRQWWSPGLYAIMGYTPEQWPASWDSFKALVRPDDWPKVLEAVKRVNTEKATIPFECMIKTHSGQYRWFLMRAKRISSDDERVTRVAGSLIDVHAQHEAQARLQAALQAAEEANLAKGRFLANMSHEIRTPINGVLGMLKLMESESLTREQQRYLQDASSSARLLLRVINDILDFSKIDAGKLRLVHGQFSLQDFARDISAILTMSAKSEAVELDISVDSEAPDQFIGDLQRLEQVVVNLGANALKFTAQGKVQVQVKLLRRTDQVARMAFSVTDTGIGIAAADLEHIFSGFSQADTANTRQFGGTGLGLAISQSLVRMMGGDIAVDSRPGQGSRFYFEIDLPLASQTPSRQIAGHADNPDRVMRLSGMRLLVVEDNVINQAVAQGLLTKEGAQVSVVDNGELAVEAVRTASPMFDAVLMDIQMPVMDGYAATQAIRQSLGLTDLPIIAMTANALPADRQACLAVGMNAHVAKPFDIQTLVGVLLSCRGQARLITAVTKPVSHAEGAAAATAVIFEPQVAVARFGGDQGVYLIALRAFAKDISTLPSQLDTLLTQRNQVEAARLVHTIKGLSGTLGATAMAAHTTQLNAQLKAANSVDDIDREAVIQALTTVTEHTATQIAGYLAEHSRLETPQLQRELTPDEHVKLVTEVRHLRTLLIQSDMAAVEAHDRLCQQALPTAYNLQALHDAMLNFDFPQAARACGDLLVQLGEPADSLGANAP